MRLWSLDNVESTTRRLSNSTPNKLDCENSLHTITDYPWTELPQLIPP